MAQLETREATQADFDFAWHVYSAFVKPLITSHMTRPWIDDEERKRFSTTWKPQNAQLVLLDGKPVGWFSCEVTSDAVEIEHGYLLPAYQDRGIGGIMLKFISEKAREQGKKLLFTTFKSNPAFNVFTRREFSVAKQDDIFVTVEVAPL